MIKKLLFIPLLLISVVLHGQKHKSSSDEPDDNNLEKYLNDGRGVSRKNLIRFRIGSAAAGYFGLSYERKVAGNLGVEAGLYVRPVSYFIFEDMRVNSPISGENKLHMNLNAVNGGVGMMLYPKYYFSGKQKRMNSGYFMGLRTTYRAFSSDVTIHTQYGGGDFPQKDVKSSSTAILFTSGSHQRMGSRMVIGVEWGMGFGWDTFKDLDNASYDYMTGKVNVQHTKGSSKIVSPYVMVDMVVGYLF